MGFVQTLIERIKSLGKKKPVAAVTAKPRDSIVLPNMSRSHPRKAGDYIERGVDEAAVLTARVKAVAHNDLDMLQSSADLKLDHTWSNILDEKA